jgi:hypothetical protein
LLKGSSASAGLELAADGTPATLWTSSETGTQWLEFDFGDVYEISRYVIRHAGANGLSRDLNTRDFMVQARAHGEAWTPLDDIRGNTSDVTDVDMEPVKARSLKIIITEPGADSTARISEVEIRGQSNQKRHQVFVHGKMHTTPIMPRQCLNLLGVKQAYRDIPLVWSKSSNRAIHKALTAASL